MTELSPTLDAGIEGTRSEIVDLRSRHPLAREWLRRRRNGLSRPRLLADQIRPRHTLLVDPEQWRPRLAIEQEYEPAFADLSDGVDSFPGTGDRQQIGRGRQIPIPEIVVHSLEVPDTPPSARIERQQRVGKE